MTTRLVWGSLRLAPINVLKLSEGLMQLKTYQFYACQFSYGQVFKIAVFGIILQDGGTRITINYWCVLYQALI